MQIRKQNTWVTGNWSTVHGWNNHESALIFCWRKKNSCKNLYLLYKLEIYSLSIIRIRLQKFVKCLGLRTFKIENSNNTQWVDGSNLILIPLQLLMNFNNFMQFLEIFLRVFRIFWLLNFRELDNQAFQMGGQLSVSHI